MMTPLEPLTHSLLTVPHGFFTRIGGISQGVYATLNTSLGALDTPEAIAHNRSRVAQHFGLDASSLLTLRQVHSATCVTIDGIQPIDTTIEADAWVTNQRGVALGVLTADCVPLLLHDPVAGVIGAAHAGWKGALAGIVQSTVQAMLSLDARTERICAVSGPSIAQQSYEVDAVFREQFLGESHHNSRYFIASSQRPDTHFMFDNKAYVRSQLEQCDIPLSQVAVMEGDTYEDAVRYFSFRRATHHKETDYGRQISVITL